MDKKYKEEIISFFKNKDLKNIKSNKLQRLKIDFSKKHNYNTLPLNSEIYNAINKKENKGLLTKPSRTNSGVTVIAVMTKPSACPGTCIYCPSYNAPKSYTGFEPAAMRGALNQYDAYKQVKNRLHQLKQIGHPTTKLEVIIMGGTFPSTSKDYQLTFIKDIYKAITDSKKKNLKDLKKQAMISEKRMIGLTIETRPDYCSKEIIKNILDYGATRVELGAQTTHDDVQLFTKRGHGSKEIIEATKNLKDSGFKVLYHMMLALPKSNYKKDLESFKEIFNNPDYAPDMIKIYPTLVTKHSEIEQMYYNGEYFPYSLNDTIKLIADIKEIVPKWVRIMRVQRDIPATKIIAGIKKSNLREFVFKELENREKQCDCIRCREPKETIKDDINKYKLKTIEYNASKGKEFFISAEINNKLLGFIRLRFLDNPFIKALDKKTTMIRELHVYGKATEFKDKNIQHIGIGKKLLKVAEEISKKHGFKKIAVISGVGVRKYYEKNGYRLVEPYMIKDI